MIKTNVLWIACQGLLALVLVLTAGDCPAATISELANTGVDANGGGVLSVGEVEPIYQLIGGVALVIEPLPTWLDAPAGSAWIGPSSGLVSDPAGDYVYEVLFDLTDAIPSTAEISGNLASDNTARIFLNGSDTGFANPAQFNALTAFSVDEGFVQGVNTLRFVVNNLSGSGVNPTGLLVSDLSASATRIPEPSAAGLLLSGVVVAIGRRVKSLV